MKYVAAALLCICAGLLFVSCLTQGTTSTPSPHSAHQAPAGPSVATPVGGGRSVNATDVMFLQMMVPHHGQGVRLATLTRNRPVRPEVHDLAAAIEVTQQAEIKTMTGWLLKWRRPLTAPPAVHAAHGGLPETSEVEISILVQATGAAFERRFLNMMIAHQDDAVQLARMEGSTGANAEVRQLARRIDQSRTAQIKEMLALLGG